jgi:hypothetical protein
MKVFAEKGMIYRNNSSSGLRDDAIPQRRGNTVTRAIKTSSR